ncbi:MAG TPA: hypothetical protein VHS28_01840 [Chloroflexota bacterium]|nr:hypothetical protein [Chloroflexota bacterium]
MKPTFVQLLPDWIYADQGYERMSGGERFTLLILAGRCSKRDESGNLKGGFCGKDTIELIGDSPSTFWARLKKLEGLGYVVTISRGGGKYANVVGIPGYKGALDHCRVERRQSKNGKGGSRPTKYKPGLVSKPRTLAEEKLLVSRIQTAGVQNPDGCRPESGEGVSRIGTLSSPIPSPIPSQHHPAGVPADDVGKDVAVAKNAALLAELEAVGIRGPELMRLSEMDIAPAAIRVLRGRVPANFKNPPVWFIMEIKHRRLPSLIDARSAAQMVNAGQARRIAGMDIVRGTKATWNVGDNKAGLTLRFPGKETPKFIPANQLDPRVFELNAPEPLAANARYQPAMPASRNEGRLV